MDHCSPHLRWGMQAKQLFALGMRNHPRIVHEAPRAHASYSQIMGFAAHTSLKPTGHAESHLECRIGHYIPVWQPQPAQGPRCPSVGHQARAV
jgi:hypothetical protein